MLHLSEEWLIAAQICMLEDPAEFPDPVLVVLEQ